MNAEEPLDDLLGSVSDGGTVDWNGAVHGARGRSEEKTIGALREVARIAEFNRGLQRSPLTDDRAVPPAFETQHWGHLTLLEKVGTGAAGEVWRAWDPKLQRDVALKFLLPANAGGTFPPADARLVEEARALARVRHRGIVAVYDIADHDGRTGMWMEFLYGSTLADEIERRGALPPADVFRIGRELCEALDAVTAAGLVHGDIKPANVILENDGRVVLTDFGLGKRVALADFDSRRGSGTPVFMSPELLSGEPSTPGSDLYALGVTLRWALTGRPPFRAKTLSELKVEVSAGAAPLTAECPDAPKSLIAAIEKAMSPDPSAGFARASEMAAMLRPEPERVERKEARSGRGRWLALAAGVVLLFGLVALLGPLNGPQTPPDSRQPAGSAAPVTASPPAVPAAYNVEATLIGRTGGAFRRLAAGDRVKPGDWLSMEFHASKPMWVYVLNEDERGEAYLLFPQPLFDVGNPITPDSAVVLPGTVGGRENAWRVTSRGGREHFLVVASTEPVAEIEAELKKLPEARPGHPIQYAPIGTATVERLRGVGGVAPLPVDATPRRAGAFERFQALAGRETVTQGVWIRKITLENPLK